jgi:hypothetical protein
LASEIEVSFAEVKRQLSQEEHEQVEKGDAIMNTNDGSPSAFVLSHSGPSNVCKVLSRFTQLVSVILRA